MRVQKWVVEAKRYFIEDADENCIPITVRKLYMTGDQVFWSGLVVTAVRRKGEYHFSIKGLTIPSKPLWRMPVEEEPKGVWKKEGRYTRKEFESWLSKRIEESATYVVDLLLTAKPKRV
jgi:hypothetical protein